MLEKTAKQRYLNLLKKVNIKACDECSEFWNNVVFCKLDLDNKVEAFIGYLLTDFITDKITDTSSDYAGQMINYDHPEEDYANLAMDTAKLYKVAVENAYCEYLDHKDEIEKIDLKDLKDYLDTEDFYDMDSDIEGWNMIYNAPYLDALSDKDKKVLDDLLAKFN